MGFIIRVVWVQARPRLSHVLVECSLSLGLSSLGFQGLFFGAQDAKALGIRGPKGLQGRALG